jgi:S-adenosylmethionine hydrolase
MAIVTLLSDFGVSDPYVGIMKGVILSLAPSTTLVDLTHDVPPQDVATGAFLLARSVEYFPSGTIHLAVVDPGVGSARRALVVDRGDRFFVAPDNGLLSMALGQRRTRAFALDDSRWFRPDVSSTFHGRDVFAPVAAHLARGITPARMGRPIARPVAIEWPRPRMRSGRVRGEVILVDRFGNLITNLERKHVPVKARIRAGAFVADRLRRGYDEVAQGELLALVSSYDLVEIAARDASAARLLGLGRGAPIFVERATT